MNNVVIYPDFESCWNQCLHWTFDLVSVLKEVYGDKGKITDLEESKTVLLRGSQALEVKKRQIEASLGKIDVHIKPVRNFFSSVQNLIRSTEVDLSRISKRKHEPFDLFDSADYRELTSWELNRNIEMVKRNVENNWIALNQNYARMLIRLKVNGYEFEF